MNCASCRIIYGLSFRLYPLDMTYDEYVERHLGFKFIRLSNQQLKEGGYSGNLPLQYSIITNALLTKLTSQQLEELFVIADEAAKEKLKGRWKAWCIDSSYVDRVSSLMFTETCREFCTLSQQPIREDLSFIPSESLEKLLTRSGLSEQSN